MKKRHHVSTTGILYNTGVTREEFEALVSEVLERMPILAHKKLQFYDIKAFSQIVAPDIHRCLLYGHFRHISGENT